MDLEKDEFPWPNADETKLAVSLCWLVDWEFGLLERHRQEMFASLNRFMDKADDMYQDFQKQWEHYGDVTELPEYDLLAEEYRTATEFIPRVQWSAQFLMLFSTFENLICRLADVAKVRLKQKTSYRDFAGTGFEPAHKYLKVVAGLESAFKSAEWNAVSVFKQLRNTLAHTRGEFKWSEEPSSLGQRMKQFKHWTVDDYSPGYACNLCLSSEFLEDAIKTLRAAALQVCNARFEGETS